MNDREKALLYKELLLDALDHIRALLDIAPPDDSITRDAKRFLERIDNDSR